MKERTVLSIRGEDIECDLTAPLEAQPEKGERVVISNKETEKRMYSAPRRPDKRT
jgi:hypothetical protein